MRHASHCTGETESEHTATGDDDYDDDYDDDDNMYFSCSRMGQLTGMCVLAEFLYGSRLGKNYDNTV